MPMPSSKMCSVLLTVLVLGLVGAQDTTSLTTPVFLNGQAFYVEDTMTVSSNLTDTVTGWPIPGETVRFTAQSDNQLYTDVITDSNGVATGSLVLTHEGDWYVWSNFFGDSSYLASESASAGPATATQQTLIVPTSSSFSGGCGGSGISVSAYVYAFPQNTSAFLPNGVITFSANGDQCTSNTDINGYASCQLVLTATGTFTLTMSLSQQTDWTAGTAYSSVISSLRSVTMTYTGPTMFANTRPGTMTAVLAADDSTPISGKSVQLTLGSYQTCHGTTNSLGVASCSPAGLISQTVGPGNQVTMIYGGDSCYADVDSHSSSILIFGYPSGGDFVVGDLALANSVANTSIPLYFYGSSWFANNPMSSANNSTATDFKGFAKNFKTDTGTVDTYGPTCSPTGFWVARSTDALPGSSTIPAYVGVMVSSAVCYDPRNGPDGATGWAVNACSPSPCLNGGTCYRNYVNGGGYFCGCASGWTGGNCNIRGTPPSLGAGNGCGTIPHSTTWKGDTSGDISKIVVLQYVASSYPSAAQGYYYTQFCP